MNTTEYIATYSRDHRAWLAQATAYGMPTDDDSFVAWHTALEAKIRARAPF